MLLRLSVLSALLIATTACGPVVAPPDQRQLARGDYGPPPKEYRTQIEVFWADRLFEPDSATFHYAAPKKAFTQRRENKNLFGWVVIHEIRAKTRSGKFAKPKRYAAFFIDGRLSHVTKTVKENGFYPVIGYAY